MSKLTHWPNFSLQEAKAVYEVIKSNRVNYWTGEQGKKFESEFSSYIGTKYSIALANGTLALDLALKALDIKSGDEVIVTPRSFIASVSCVVNAGAKPIFAEIDKDSGNITADSISKVVTSRTKAIICVHLAGWPCDMDPIMKLAKGHSIFVIEDCAQAHGSLYKKRNVGSIGHIGCWSFCQDKIMTTGGEGGMIATNNKKLWERMWSYKDHGKSYKAVNKLNHPPGFKWLHESFGTNFRMTEMQAAIGRYQLKKLDGWVKKRNRNAAYLKRVCDKFPKILRTPIPDESVNHSYYKFYTYVITSGLKRGWTRNKIINTICSKGVPCFEGSCPEIYLESAFKNTRLRPKKRLPVAKELGESSILFLVHPTLVKKDLKFVGKIIEEVFQEATL